MHPASASQGLFSYADPQKNAPWPQHPHATLFLWLVTSFVFVILTAVLLRFTEGLLTPAAAHAASTDYVASIVSVSAPRTLGPGEAGLVSVTLKNIGVATWKKDGANFASIYHWDPVRKVEVTSLISTTGWDSDKRATRLPVSEVKPGQSVTLRFPIRAPSVAGSYKSFFTLTAENAAWVRYGSFSVDLQVGSGSVSVPVAVVSPTVAPTTPAPVPTAAFPVRTDWKAELVSKGGNEWQIEIEDHVTAELAFKNTGTNTWKRDGEGFVSVYATEGTKERTSFFKDHNWLSGSQAVKLKEIEVKPGQIGHFLLELRAPRAPGFYNETFTLASEDKAWVYGSTVTLPIRVPMNAQFIASQPVGSDVITSVAANPLSGMGEYTAALLLRSASQLSLLGNGRQTLTYGFKNTGNDPWNSLGVRIKGVVPALAGTLSSVRDDSWSSSVEPIRIQAVTKPGEIGFLKFTIKAPAKMGSYKASFQLFADDRSVEGGEIEIPITVTADGYIEPAPVPPKPITTTQPSTPSNPTPVFSFTPAPLSGDPSSLPNEPLIRVGLFKTTDDRMVVRAKYAPINVTQNGSTLCRLNVGESATVSFDRTNKVYKLQGGSCAGQSTSIYLFRAEDTTSPMEIADVISSNNTFRAQLELRYTPATDAVWVINELPVEYYLKGIGETSNISPQQFQRTLLTTARTYAMYHVQRQTKHADENYTVDATYDQVYRGYGQEARSPNIVAAVDATRGQVVTYDGKMVITPYFSRSDGRTRDWTEVWAGGPYPWLVSVPVPQDQGKTLWGHGVGMSATGALTMANEGRNYQEILTHFYRGTELRRLYK